LGDVGVDEQVLDAVLLENFMDPWFLKTMLTIQQKCMALGL